MKCSGKQQSYPSEIERIEKASREQKFNDVIKQAQENEKNIESVTDDEQNDFQQCKQLINSLENKFKKATEDILALKQQDKDYSNKIDTFGTTLEQQKLSLVARMHDNEQKTKALETESKKASDIISNLKGQLNDNANKIDDVIEDVTAAQEQQNSLDARVDGIEQQIKTVSINLSDKLNQLERQTKENFTILATDSSAQIKTVKILEWDPSKYFTSLKFI